MLGMAPTTKGEKKMKEKRIEVIVNGISEAILPDHMLTATLEK